VQGSVARPTLACACSPPNQHASGQLQRLRCLRPPSLTDPEAPRSRSVNWAPELADPSRSAALGAPVALSPTSVARLAGPAALKKQGLKTASR